MTEAEERPAAAPDTLVFEDPALFEDLAGLRSKQQRSDFFRHRIDLLQADLVRALCSEVSRLFGVDLERARNLAETARWLAEKLAHEPSRARSARAAANVAHSLGETTRAQELYGEALDRFEELEEEKEAAVTRSSALLNLAFLGEHGVVDAWYRSARETFEHLADRRRLATLEHNFGIILGRQDRWEEALESYTAACEEFRRLDRAQDVAICLRNIAVCQINLHDFTAALDVYRDNRAYCLDHGLTRILLQIDYNIAYLFYLRGEYTRAIRLFQAARRDCATAGDEYHAALCDLDQAEIYLDLNLVEEAAKLAQAAITTFDGLSIPYEGAKALTFRAIALSRQGRTIEALTLLRRARETFVSERNRLWPALIDFYCAVVLTRDGKPRDAIRLARGAREVFAELSLAPRVAMCELLIAELLLALGKPSEARASCHDALARLAGLDLPALEHRVFLVLGQVEEAIGDRQAAIDAYHRSHRWLEKLRSQLQGDDLKIAFLKDKHVVYESLVWLTLEGGLPAEREEVAFGYVEASKSRSLADLMAFRAHALAPRSEARGELAERTRALREELGWLYRQIDVVQMRPSEHYRQKVEALRPRIRRKEGHLLRSLRELRATDREFTSLQPGEVIDLETVRASLPADTTLIEYYIARGRVFVFVVGRDDLEVVPLAAAAKAREIYRFLQFQLSRSTSEDQSPAASQLAHEAMRAHLEELYAALIDPIRDRLRTERLVVVPHGFLHYVPFHALHDGDSYLTDRFTISYAPSAEVFHLCSMKRAAWDDCSVVLGVADERAPYILEEARAVAASLPRARLLLGEDASAEELRRHGARARYLHIATHGLFRRDNPMFSAIQLGATRLSLFDLYDLRLAAELVVLSGCGTGLGAVLGGEELVGLTRGLLYAGAQSVVVTLWDVHDASAAVFMRRFWQHLTAGSGRAQALRQAMWDLRDTYPSPYHWAPFIMVGKPTGAEL
ncbi:MAG: CHAT domain-containing protein [bacterium]|nr:CHAT domain-containing protein [bacterium]